MTILLCLRVRWRYRHAHPELRKGLVYRRAESSRPHAVIHRDKGLTPESQAALRSVDLHFHDLRREAGSRWLDLGVPLHTIRDWLGHTNIEQTSTSLAGTQKTQHNAMRQFEQRKAALQQLATVGETGGIEDRRRLRA